jgi:hypothetical protein
MDVDICTFPLVFSYCVYLHSISFVHIELWHVVIGTVLCLEYNDNTQSATHSSYGTSKIKQNSIWS